MITILVEQQNQVLPLEGAHVEEQSRTLVGPEAQGDIFVSQRHVRKGGGRMKAVDEQRLRFKDGRNLFTQEYNQN